uniref:Protein MAK10 homolog n=1 Tax=Schistosoma japonicum TaxID=6182 RepID=C1LGK2_SCHJA|nr:Mak10 subunit, NatC N(alpha)-terminal acetyltransferase domain-containing protein [Schistosoma japonicum]
MHTELSEESIADSVRPDLTSVCTPMDITNAFFSACRIGLEPGELMHDNEFNLQHSMSAIEIMDPKVDARTQGNRKVVTISEALSADQLPLGPFSSLYELLGIMDELLSSYVNWLTGDSLAQSVFICMYMHCTQLIKDKYLVAFCELLRRSIYQLRHIIISLGVFNEEDHYTFTHDMPIREPSNIFDGYGDFCNICLHKFRTFGLVAHVNELIKNLEHDSIVFTDCDDKLLMGLRSRLEFIQVLLSFTNSIYKRIGSDCNSTEDLFEGYTDADIDFVGEKSSPKLYKVQDDTQVLWVAFIDFCRNVSQHTTRLESLSNTLLETSNIGKVAGDGKLKPKDTAYGLPGFEVFLNQTNIPSLMLTVVNIHDRHKSFVYFSNLFKRLNHILLTYENFALWHNVHPYPLRLHSLWAFIQKCGQVSCSYVKALSFPDNSSELNEPTLSTCVLSRAITYILYFALMCQGDIIYRDPESISPIHFHCFVNAWHQLECVAYRPLIKNIISSIPELTDFLTTLSTHFARIPAIYCLNRSRQRSALRPWLEHFPDFLDECARAEFIIGVELRNKLANVTTANCFESLGKFEDLITQKFVVPVQINLSHFITYVYYYLAWDYIASGFQLELYSSNEWLFIYAFMIHLFQNLGALVKSLSENYMVLASRRSDTVECEPVGNKGLKPNSKCDSVNDVEKLDSRQRKNKKKHRGKYDISSVNSISKEMPNTVNFNGVSGPFSPMIHEIGSTFEVHSLNIHQYLNTASLYAIRALQRDSGIEIDENGVNSNFTFSFKVAGLMNGSLRLESYARRLGIFLIPHNSPLVEMGGVYGAYRTWTSLIGSSIIDGHPTSDLYLMASKAFDQAYNMIQETLCLQSFGEEQLLTFMQSHIYISLFTERFGPPDRLTDLQQLAKHNSIACRVLGVCEDRRPIVHTSNPSITNPKMSFLCSSSPVKLDYTFLESKCYPLIRLTNQSGKC